MIGMESEREQLLYGNHCIHGTATGTAGGADFMCGLCEDGMDKWVEDIGYALQFRFSDAPLDDEWAHPWTKVAEWRASNPPAINDIHARKSVDSWFDLFNDPTISRDTMAKIQHRVAVTSKGYWDYPDAR